MLHKRYVSFHPTLHSIFCKAEWLTLDYQVQTQNTLLRHPCFAILCSQYFCNVLEIYVRSVFTSSYWEPGPNANHSSYAFLYYTGGFLFIQDMVEQGIRSTQVSPEYAPLYYELGAYLQELPYPCYLDDEWVGKSVKTIKNFCNFVKDKYWNVGVILI